MPNKIFNLFTREIRFGWRIIVIFILTFLSVYAWNKVTMASVELKKIEQEKILVSSVASMEQELSALESRQKFSKADLSGELPIINGIWIQDDFPIALVGDSFLREGDSIGQFTISKIAEHKVILTDKLTRLNKEINF